MKNYSCLILCFLSIQMIFATDYYCDPVNGKESNIGTKTSPWKTLASVFEKGAKLNDGDVVFLLSGNHGDVKITGVNEKYINIKAVEGETPIVNSIVFGTEEIPASRWVISNVNFKGSASSIVFIHENSTRIRLIENQFISVNSMNTAITIKGTQCKIESNVISNFKNGIKISGNKNQIRNNRIAFFNNNAIEVSGEYNLLEYNLIKESVVTDSDINNGIYLNDLNIKGTIFRGNTIINFITFNRDNIGLCNGIYGKNLNVSESVFENNVIVSNGENGISVQGELSNLKIVNNTVVNPYFGLDFEGNTIINSPLKIKVLGLDNSSNIIIGNNLCNDVLFENIKGVADHNLTIPVSVHDFDMCFKNWALFDFSLGSDSKALNMGASDMAPTLDVSLNKRALGNFVNIGAFEYTKINEGNEVFKITSQISDRQIHSKGKGDWDGQAEIRIGGVGEDLDGAGVFPFKIPSIPVGKKILKANFKVYLTKIDNQPQGGIDLYGLPPKANYWVTEDMYYQGTYGQDVSARPIQNNFIDSDMYSGVPKMSSSGQTELGNYLNTVVEAGSKSGDFVFLRMNPNSKNVTDFSRWNFVSANNDQKDKQPELELTVGYPELNQGNVNKKEAIKNTIVTASSPINNGDVAFYFFGIDPNENVDLKLLNSKGEQVFTQTLKLSNLSDNVYRTDNLDLSTGKYFLEYLIGTETKKQILFVW